MAELEKLRQEVRELRQNSVPREQHVALQEEVQQLRSSLDLMKSQFNKRLLELMNEVDEEKKVRLNAQVEMERVKKLVMSS